MFFSLLRWSREARWPMENVDFLLLGVRGFHFLVKTEKKKKIGGMEKGADVKYSIDLVFMCICPTSSSSNMKLGPVVRMSHCF